MIAASQADVLKRLNFIEGHLAGIRRMVEADKYCVDILKQTFAEGRDDAVLSELSELYEMAGK
jgi:DNA-binding FrmR family transcriptional regulator